MSESIDNSNYSISVKNKIKVAFNDKLAEIDEKKSLDLSDNTSTTEIINRLRSNINYFAQKYLAEEAAVVKATEDAKYKAVDKVLQRADEIISHTGGYTSKQYIEERYNPATKNFEVFQKNNLLSEIYFDGNTGRLWTNTNNKWAYIEFEYVHTSGNYMFKGVNFDIKMEINSYFNSIIIYVAKVGNDYTKRVYYMDLKKDNSVFPHL